VAELAAARTDDVLAILQDIAVLVHGNWVVKSDVVYPDAYRSPVSGVGAAHMRIARDYIVHRLHELPNDRPPPHRVRRESPAAFSRPQVPYRGDHSQDYYAPGIATHFAENGTGTPVDRDRDRDQDQDGDGRRYLRRGDVARVMGEWHVRVEKDDLVDMLKGVATMVVGRGWVFRNKTDHEFLSTYPLIVERQREAHARRIQMLHDTAASALHPRRPTLAQHQPCVYSAG
jgi:hypothetical protein